MKARTHTEVYRPFRGALKDRPKRALTLAWSGVRVGFRKKLPMILLFIWPGIATIVGAFQIQLKFDSASGNLGFAGQGESIGDAMAGQMVMTGLDEMLGPVELIIINALESLQFFAVLAMGWYGAGLIAEDKRLRANLLYFARPITRWTYLRGKIGTVMFWGSCAVLLPVIMMCGTAVFASPEWSYLTDRWGMILRFQAFALGWVAVHALLILALSSVCRLRNQALAGLFGLYFLLSIGGELLAWLFDEAEWRLISIVRNSQRISRWLFDMNEGEPWNVLHSFGALGALGLACLLVLNSQLKKMELGR